MRSVLAQRSLTRPGVLEDVLTLQKTGHAAGSPRIRERSELALDEAVINIARIATSRETQRQFAQTVRAASSWRS